MRQSEIRLSMCVLVFFVGLCRSLLFRSSVFAIVFAYKCVACVSLCAMFVLCNFMVQFDSWELGLDISNGGNRGFVECLCCCFLECGICVEAGNRTCCYVHE